MPERSNKEITHKDLRRLGEIAKGDRLSHFSLHPETGKLYSNRLFAVALCQGAAMHFVDGKTGIKDFDVWSFYRARPKRMFPPRRRGKADFGNPKFGITETNPDLAGRRVDLMGRSIESSNYSDPVEVLRRYLRAKKTKTAKLLSQKAVILIEPSHLLGTIVWPE